jgi:hypothetical protein
MVLHALFTQMDPTSLVSYTEQMEEEDAREEEDVDPAFTGKAAGKKKSKK